MQKKCPSTQNCSRLTSSWCRKTRSHGNQQKKRKLPKKKLKSHLQRIAQRLKPNSENRNAFIPVVVKCKLFFIVDAPLDLLKIAKFIWFILLYSLNVILKNFNSLCETYLGSFSTNSTFPAKSYNSTASSLHCDYISAVVAWRLD